MAIANFFSQLVTRIIPSKRAAGNVNDERLWTPYFSGPNTHSGAGVTPDTAMTYSAVYSCVKIISETIAQLPIRLYSVDSRQVKNFLPDHPIASLLDNPNSYQTRLEFFELSLANVLTRGNGYALIEFGRSGRAERLFPLRSDCVTPKFDANGDVEYHFTGKNGKKYIIDPIFILHFRNIAFDGITGISPITAAKESIGVGLAAQQHGSMIFSQGARPSGVLTTPQTLNEAAAARIAASWHSAYGGMQGAHKIAILEEGTSFQPISITNEDAQWLETRKFQLEEISRFYRIPLPKLGSLDRATFSNIESLAIQFVQDAIEPWVKRFELSMKRDLLFLEQDRDVHIDIDTSSLLRGDAESRMKTYMQARQSGIYTTNEIRSFEGLNPLGEEADQLWAPVNMQNAKALINVPEPEQERGEQQTQTDPEENRSHITHCDSKTEQPIGAVTPTRALDPSNTGNSARDKVLLGDFRGATSRISLFLKRNAHKKDLYDRLTPFLLRQSVILCDALENTCDAFSIEIHRALLAEFIEKRIIFPTKEEICELLPYEKDARVHGASILREVYRSDEFSTGLLEIFSCQFLQAQETDTLSEELQ